VRRIRVHGERSGGFSCGKDEKRNRRGGRDVRGGKVEEMGERRGEPEDGKRDAGECREGWSREGIDV